MRFPWGSEEPRGEGQVPDASGAGGSEAEGHGLVGSAEKGVREVLLLFLSMVLVLFNLLGQRRGPGSQT